MKAQLIITLKHAGNTQEILTGTKGYVLPANNLPNTDKFYFISKETTILVNRNEFAKGWDNNIVWCEIINRQYEKTGILPDISNLE